MPFSTQVIFDETRNMESLVNNANTKTIELIDLSTGYKVKGKKLIISNELNASLVRDELVCLLGPNGAGKSTLLRTIVGFQAAIGGHVSVCGKSIEKYRSSELSRLVSVVLTDNSGIKNMSVYDVVAMGRSPYTGFWGRINEKDKKVIDNCLQWVGITDLKERKMQTLSDGERQKVMIAKAIAQETPIIVLDEPTAYLDYPSKMSMLMLLHRMAKALHKTIFLSTHDVEHALQIADHVWLMDKKLGLVTGTPEDLCLNGRIEQYFNREGMTFDRALGAFSVQHKSSHDLVVEGDKHSIPYILLCKALARHNIRPVDACDDRDVLIRVEANGEFTLMQFGKKTSGTQSIEKVVGDTFSLLAKTKMFKVTGGKDYSDEDDVPKATVNYEDY